MTRNGDTRLPMKPPAHFGETDGRAGRSRRRAANRPRMASDFRSAWRAIGILDGKRLVIDEMANQEIAICAVSASVQDVSMPDSINGGRWPLGMGTRAAKKVQIVRPVAVSFVLRPSPFASNLFNDVVNVHHNPAP